MGTESILSAAALEQLARTGKLKRSQVERAALVLADRGENELAIEILKNCELRDHPELCFALATLLQAAGRALEAEIYYKRAIESRPKNPGYHAAIGLLYHGCLSRFDQAKASYMAVLDVQSKHQFACTQLASLYVAEAGAQGTMQGFSRYLGRDLDESLRSLALANGFAALGHYQPSSMEYRRALALWSRRPDDPCGLWILGGLAKIARALGDHSTADECLSTAEAEYPNHPLLRVLILPERIRSLLALGHKLSVGAAYRGLLDGRQTLSRAKPSGIPEWTGQPLEDRTLLVTNPDSAGFGDDLMSFRFLPLLKWQAGNCRIIAVARNPLLPLIRSMPEVDEVCLPHDVCQADYHVVAPHIPLLLDWTWRSFADKAAAIRPSDLAIAKWRPFVSGGRGIKVGVCWHTDVRRCESDAYSARSLPIRLLKPLAEIPGVRLFSLQFGAGARFSEGIYELGMTDLTGRIKTFDDTAALISHLDAVVTIDTATAHLVGAMGKRGIVLLPFFPCWRWAAASDSCPLYPNLRLARQSAPGDWSNCIESASKFVRAITDDRSCGSTTRQTGGPMQPQG